MILPEVGHLVHQGLRCFQEIQFFLERCPTFFFKRWLFYGFVFIFLHTNGVPFIYLEYIRMKKVIPALILIGGGIAVFAWFITSTTRQADMLIINAKVYTVDAQNSVADAIAIRGDKIAAVGTADDLKRRYTSENIFDAEGKTVVPGFIDSHGHVSGLGSSLVELNLVGTASVQQIGEMVAKKASSSTPGQWIRGRGWDQNIWASKSKDKPFPTASMLDKSSPNNPVVTFPRRWPCRLAEFASTRNRRGSQ